jgi:hypothetical protein
VVSPDDREKILGIYRMGIFGDSLLGWKPDFDARATAHEEYWVSEISLRKLHGPGSPARFHCPELRQDFEPEVV